ncbi:MAG TPA: TrbI/VirB10 family protein [Sphingobium sp.]
MSDPPGDGTSSARPASPAAARDVRPLVGTATDKRGIWLFVAMLVFLAILLFIALENRRATVSEPSLGEGTEQAGSLIAPPPALAIPPAYGPDYDDRRWAQRAPPPVDPAPYSRPATPIENPRAKLVAPPQSLDPDTLAALQGAMRQSLPPSPSTANAVTDTTAMPAADAGPGRPAERVRATRFANPSTTVPKGTVIQAVLETALDSTRAGFARAIVSRDIVGFDGSQILIPRGSRLIGDYKADLQPGQRRALIQWQRLMRPDGAVINLDSPSADPLGRAGVEGKVNSHFIARFGGSILQSALNIGTQVAVSQAAPAGVIYAIPLQTPSMPAIASEKVQPTVKVRQGTSVSVFVARDLDFTTVSAP